MDNINFIISNLDEIDELSFKDIKNSISKGYDSTKEFISDTAVNIQEKFHYIHTNLSKLISRNNNSLSLIENKLKDSGIDVLKLKSLATEESKKQLFKIRKNEFNIFTFVKLVGNAFNNIFNMCLPKKNSIPRQIIVAVTLLAFAFYINTAIHIMGITLTGSELSGSLLACCLGAPFTEELGKIISINQNAGGAYFIIFNIAEWTLYVRNVMSMVTGIPAFMTIAIIRIICAYGHYLYSRIHAASSKTAESREAGMRTGMIFHALHNLISHTNLAMIYLPIDLYLSRKKVNELDNKNKKSISSNKKRSINSLIQKLKFR